MSLKMNKNIEPTISKEELRCEWQYVVVIWASMSWSQRRRVVSFTTTMYTNVIINLARSTSWASALSLAGWPASQLVSQLLFSSSLSRVHPRICPVTSSQNVADESITIYESNISERRDCRSQFAVWHELSRFTNISSRSTVCHQQVVAWLSLANDDAVIKLAVISVILTAGQVIYGQIDPSAYCNALVILPEFVFIFLSSIMSNRLPFTLFPYWFLSCFVNVLCS